MPLELGMALSIRYQSKGSGTPHNWVAMVPHGFVHQEFISDLAGFDPPAHEQTPVSVIKAISGWLTIQPDYSPPAPSPRAILEAYPKLVELLEEAKTEGLGHLTWPVIVRSVERVVTAMSEPSI
jgi:hypothetical protein